ncbi:sulfotransferase [Arenimonas sp.]|uniref:tetratricopeptide repeat-containing sulfotransferase family protein n=1 Tax=Arenimonas sp. TaxID=1872635 RepID=UPI0039E672BD
MERRSERLLQRGIAHYRVGELGAAQACFDAVLAREPGNGPARFRLSILAEKRGRHAEALALIQQVARDEQPRQEVFCQLARTQLANGLVHEARESVDRALAFPLDKPALLDSLGIVLSQLGEPVRALKLFEQAIAISPGRSFLHYNCALALRALDRNADAEKHLETCLQLQPRHAKAHLALAELRVQNAAYDHVERLRQRWLSRAVEEGGEEFVALALYRELDDLGRHGEAWDMLQQAMNLRAARTNAGVSPGLWDLIQNEPTDSNQDENGQARLPAPVFIVGLPRSGVELLARRLAQHNEVVRAVAQSSFAREMARAAGGDPRPVLDRTLLESSPAASDAAIAERMRSVAAKTGGAVWLHAQPLDFLLIGRIARAMPEARFLHMQRDARDVLLAQLAQPSPWPSGSEAAPPLQDAEALADYCLRYRQLMQHWHERLPGRILDVQYESLVEKPEMLLRVACAFIGLGYQPGLRFGPRLQASRIGRAAAYAGRLAEAFERLDR